jgi:hypothetical protein
MPWNEGQVNRQGWIACQNEGEETIPAHGVAEASAVETRQGETFLSLSQPSALPSAFRSNFVPVINSEIAIPGGGFGRCVLATSPAWALVDDPSGNPGTSWGPLGKSYKLTKGHLGFTKLGDHPEQSGRILVIRNGNDTLGSRLLGKTTDTHLKGETKDVAIYMRRSDTALPGSELPGGTLVAAYNRMADLDADIWVHLVIVLDTFEIVAAETPACGS